MLLRLVGYPQKYEWGCLGSSSLVSGLHDANLRAVSAAGAKNVEKFEVGAATPFAELWLGNHANGKNYVLRGDSTELVPLDDFLKSLSTTKGALKSLNSANDRTGSTAFSGSSAAESPSVRGDANEDVALESETEKDASNLDSKISGTPEQSKSGNDKLVAEFSYLFKVLSIAKPLSLQVHPHAAKAAELHKNFPDIYRDPEEKVECAIAISDTVEAFCGFKKLKSILTTAIMVPEISEFLQYTPDQDSANGSLEITPNQDENTPTTETTSSTAKLNAAFSTSAKNIQSLFTKSSPSDSKCLKQMIQKIFAADEDHIVQLIDSILEKTKDLDAVRQQCKNLNHKEDDKEEENKDVAHKGNPLFSRMSKAMGSVLKKTDKAYPVDDLIDQLELFARLHKFYPYDRGIFAAFYLNHMIIHTGDCLVMLADTIHAYIEGHVLECMRNSDNVIRAGLTPKLKDVPALLDVLDSHPASPSSLTLKPHKSTCKFSSVDGDSTNTGPQASRLLSYDVQQGEFKVYLLMLAAETSALMSTLPKYTPIVALCLTGYGEISNGETTCQCAAGQSFVLWSTHDGISVHNSTTLTLADYQTAKKSGAKTKTDDKTTETKDPLKKSASDQGAAPKKKTVEGGIMPLMSMLSKQRFDKSAVQPIEYPNLESVQSDLSAKDNSVRSKDLVLVFAVGTKKD